MRSLKDVRFIGSLAIEPSGAIIQRQLIERSITISDRFFARLLRWCFEILVVIDFLICLYDSIDYFIDFFFTSTRDDLALIISAMVVDYVPVPTPQTG